jgi:glycosyltransferase involved in cell wall biosynthesis
VRDNENGFLLPPGQVNAIRDALLFLCEHEDTRRRMGEAGRSQVETDFRIETMAEGNLEVYRSILEPTAPGN